MLDTRPSLPTRFRLLNAAARYLLAEKLAIARLDEETLSNEAVKETGLTDFGDPYYREGLLALLVSAEKDANLHFLGRIAMRKLVAIYLSNRLLLAEARKRTPELFQQHLIPPIIVLGLPRTGSTFLHKMLALDPAHRGVPAWELLRPLPTGTEDRRREFADRELKRQRKVNPRLDRIHLIGPDEPEECMVLQGTTFSSAFFFVMAPVYGYADWGISYDQTKAYEEYHSLLQVLQMVEPKRRLTLKAPAHTGALPTLFQTIPDALIIQTHRNPVEACTSACSLFYWTWSTVTRSIDVPRMAEALTDILQRMAVVSLRFHETNPDVIYDVYYEQLVSDPVSAVRCIYNHFGLAWTDEYEERLRVYVKDHHQGKHGRHNYCPEDFGLTDNSLAKRFAEYSEIFGITPK